VSIRAMCNRVLVMDHGHLVHDGPVEEGIDFYTKLAASGR
jgi:ABC-type polysaccharide/polyol phosphate transport system ATPase subunit